MWNCDYPWSIKRSVHLSFQSSEFSTERQLFTVATNWRGGNLSRVSTRVTKSWPIYDYWGHPRKFTCDYSRYKLQVPTWQLRENEIGVNFGDHYDILPQGKLFHGRIGGTKSAAEVASLWKKFLAAGNKKLAVPMNYMQSLQYDGLLWPIKRQNRWEII